MTSPARRAPTVKKCRGSVVAARTTLKRVAQRVESQLLQVLCRQLVQQSQRGVHFRGDGGSRGGSGCSLFKEVASFVRLGPSLDNDALGKTRCGSLRHVHTRSSGPCHEVQHFGRGKARTSCDQLYVGWVSSASTDEAIDHSNGSVSTESSSSHSQNRLQRAVTRSDYSRVGMRHDGC